MLLCGGRDLEMSCGMPPNAERQTAEEQQQRAEAEQPSTGTTAAIVLAGWPPLDVSAPRGMLYYAMVAVGHLKFLRKDALRGFAVVAFAQHGE
jgi:hypothetical protein